MTTPVKSLSDLKVGQIVAFVDDADHRRDAVCRVAFVDPPEAILKYSGNGWPRIRMESGDFQLKNIHLFILQDAPAADFVVPEQALADLREAVDVVADGDVNVSVAELSRQVAELAMRARALISSAKEVKK